MKVAKPVPIRLSGGISLEQQLINLPKKQYIGASRYNTDDESKLHLWDSEGRSYDLKVPRYRKGLI